MPPKSSSATTSRERKWSHEDDEALTAALERGDGQLSWAEVASIAFPDGKFDQTECNDVRSSPSLSLSLSPAAE